jgi:cysteinyl-tRNA synthetase
MLMGLLGKTASEYRSASVAAASIDTATVELLISARNAARREKNFSAADRIRNELAAMGVVLKDSKDGTTWEIAR